jgi:hypothetical protein
LAAGGYDSVRIGIPAGPLLGRIQDLLHDGTLGDPSQNTPAYLSTGSASFSAPSVPLSTLSTLTLNVGRAILRREALSQDIYKQRPLSD